MKTLAKKLMALVLCLAMALGLLGVTSAGAVQSAPKAEESASKVIYAVEDNALCGQTGLQAGDEIVAVNGRRCFVANDILYELVRTEAYRADFTVKRDGQKVNCRTCSSTLGRMRTARPI